MVLSLVRGESGDCGQILEIAGLLDFFSNIHHVSTFTFVLIDNAASCAFDGLRKDRVSIGAVKIKRYKSESTAARKVERF